MPNTNKLTFNLQKIKKNLDFKHYTYWLISKKKVVPRTKLMKKIYLN